MIDRKILDPDAVTNIGKMEKAPEDPTEWRQAILHQFGSGNYKLMLKDEGKGIEKAIAQTFVVDLQDPEYPAVIENYDELVMDHPSNQSFIEKCRQDGKLPRENQLAQEETASALTGTIDRLATKLAERKPELAQTQPQPGAADTAKAAMDMARDVFKQGMDLGQETVTAKANAEIAEAKAKAEAANPAQSMTMLTQIIDLVQKIAPKPAEAAAAPPQDLTGLIKMLMERGDNLQTQMMAGLQKQIELLATNRAAPGQVATGEAKPDDFMGQLEKMIGMKEKLQRFLGVGAGGSEDEPEREEKVPVWMQLAGEAFKVLPAVGMQAVAMTHNLAVARTGQGAPLGPGAMPAVEAAPGMEGITASNPQSQPQGETMNPFVLTMLKQIEKPLLKHLDDPESSGADFAEALMAFQKSRSGYDVIRVQGKETIMGWFNDYPPIGEVIKQNPERASQFIDDFLNADAIIAAEQAEAEAEPDGAAFVQGEGG